MLIVAYCIVAVGFFFHVDAPRAVGIPVGGADEL